MDINEYIFSGNLTRDVELKHLDGGTIIGTVGVATNNRVKRNGEYQDEPCFWDVIVFNKTAENCAKFLSKGSNVVVSGSIQMDRWETEDGQKRSKHKVVANKIKFPSKSEASSDSSSYGKSTPDESIPF